MNVDDYLDSNCIIQKRVYWLYARNLHELPQCQAPPGERRSIQIWSGCFGSPTMATSSPETGVKAEPGDTLLFYSEQTAQTTPANYIKPL